jgi:hypothetical protein
MNFKFLLLVLSIVSLLSAFNGGYVKGLSVITSPVDSKVYFRVNHSIGVDQSSASPAWAAWNVCYIECSSTFTEKNAYTFALLQKALLDQSLKINLNAAIQVPIMGTGGPGYGASITDWSISK